MNKDQLEQIRNKIYTHMISVDLEKLSLYDLIYYVNAYKALEGMSPFWGFNSCNMGLGLDSPSNVVSQS